MVKYILASDKQEILLIDRFDDLSIQKYSEHNVELESEFHSGVLFNHSLYSERRR